MCSIEEFKKANNKGKSRLLDKFGVYLNLCIFKNNQIVVLYALTNYYVEVYHDIEYSEIVKTRCITSIKGLEPFLKLINIDEITSLLVVR